MVEKIVKVKIQGTGVVQTIIAYKPAKKFWKSVD